jgi:hypothetical protein
VIGPITTTDLETMRDKINELIDFANELEIAMDEITAVAETNRDTILHQDDEPDDD